MESPNFKKQTPIKAAFEHMAFLDSPCMKKPIDQEQLEEINCFSLKKIITPIKMDFEQ